MIVEYLLKAADIYFGLSPKECRKLAYRFAKANHIEIPKSWYDKQQAGPDWLTHSRTSPKNFGGAMKFCPNYDFMMHFGYDKKIV